jgi:3-oxoacyl-[acyl-carrier-protein] synthase II
MNKRQRAVITGVGSVSPYGAGANLLSDNILAQKAGINFNEELSKIPDMNSHIAAQVPEMDFSYIPRQFRRSMSNMSLYAAAAVREALTDAGFENAPKETALFLGSTISSMQTWVDFAEKYSKKELDTVKTNVVFQVMNHSPLANIAQAFDIKGAGIGSNAACATGLMNAGLAYLAVSSGFTDIALCGGTDEYHPIMTCCFAIMNAASHNFNDAPQKASRPFDADRCGIVCGEGCGMLIVESLQSALSRKARIYGEIIGFATNTETKSISHPSKESIKECMQKALDSAQIKSDEIDFINAHATATLAGDIEEAKAISEVFGKEVFVNSLKGHIGHTMAASGALELIASLDMMKREKFAPTLNLENIDPQCEGINLFNKVADLKVKTFIKNSFALGGTNCSLIIRRY